MKRFSTVVATGLIALTLTGCTASAPSNDGGQSADGTQSAGEPQSADMPQSDPANTNAPQSDDAIWESSGRAHRIAEEFIEILSSPYEPGWTTLKTVDIQNAEIIQITPENDSWKMLGEPFGYSDAVVISLPENNCDIVGILCGIVIEVWPTFEAATERMVDDPAPTPATDTEPMQCGERGIVADNVLLRVNCSVGIHDMMLMNDLFFYIPEFQ